MWHHLLSTLVSLSTSCEWRIILIFSTLNCPKLILVKMASFKYPRLMFSPGWHPCTHHHHTLYPCSPKGDRCGIILILSTLLVSRLTPLYAAIIMIYTNLWMYMGSGPLWPPLNGSTYFCKDNWWTNLLYVNNLVRAKEMVRTRLDCTTMSQIATWALLILQFSCLLGLG